MAEKKLTKKQQKSADFRKKRKLDDSIADVPEADTAAVDDQSAAKAKAEEPKSKKAKKDTKEGADAENAGKKKRRRGKGGKAGMDDEKDGEKKEEGSTESNGTAAKPKPQNQKFIVFVGNLPFNITKEQLEKHFASCENITSIRLQTDKATGKGKGFAFMEFSTSEAMQKALFFNKTLIKERPINVELTAGGGGNKSEARKKKIAEKNEALNEERRKIHEKHIQPSKEAKSSYASSEPQKKLAPTVKQPSKSEKAFKRPGDVSDANAIQVNSLAARLRRG